MRKIIVFNIISLDGSHTGPDNDVSVLFPVMGGVFDTYTAERLRAADMTLVGRVSFQLFNSFWPEVAKDPTSEKWTPGQREISQAGESLPTIVVSDTLTGNWPDVRIVRCADANPQIAELKRQPGKDILITGSRTLWNDLLAHDLVDEIHLMIGNVLLGEGVWVFEGKPDVSLRLIDIRKWEDSDNVLLCYEVRHKSVYRSFLMNEPITTIDPRYSDPRAVATSWEETRRVLETAELFWLATVRADGRPHVTPVVGVWHDGALYFSTAETEQKAINMRGNPHVILTTGCNTWNTGLDVVVEGDAVRIADQGTLERLASLWATKWDGRWKHEVRDGYFYHYDEEEHKVLPYSILVFEVKPTKVYAHGKGDPFSHTRHQF